MHSATDTVSWLPAGGGAAVVTPPGYVEATPIGFGAVPSNESADASDVRVGIVTVAYRSDTVLTGFLASVPAATSAPVAIVVADNLPAEGDAASIAERARAAYVPIPANPGYGAAINAAVDRLPEGVEWILIANPDVELDAGALDRLVETGRGCRTRRPDLSPPGEARRHRVGRQGLPAVLALGSVRGHAGAQGLREPGDGPSDAHRDVRHQPVDAVRLDRVELLRREEELQVGRGQQHGHHA